MEAGEGRVWGWFRFVKGSFAPVCVVLMLVLPASASMAQEAEEPDVGPHGPWSTFPIIGSSPTTSAIFGAGLVYTFQADEDSINAEKVRRSSISALSFYSLRNQFAASLTPTVYWQGETWRASGSVDARHFPDSRFWAPGDDTGTSDVERYTEREFSGKAALTRRLVGSLRLGAQVQGSHTTIADTEEGGALAENQVTGNDGGLSIGVGPVLEWDDRDSDFETRSGGLYNTSMSFFPGALGDFDFRTYEVDMRQFFPVWFGHTVALQATARFTNGEVPFTALAQMGGPDRMRGYAQGRFRDRHTVTGQAEYRAPLWWRFGMVGFAGIGDVANTVGSDLFDAPKFAGGGGLRYTINKNERINLRFDGAGTSTGDFNFYFGLGEAF